MDAAKLKCEHPSTLLHPACLFPWILGVFDTMAIVGNGCGKIRGGWEQPILAICLQYAGKRGRRFMVSDHQWHTANSVFHFDNKLCNLGYSLILQNFFIMLKIVDKIWKISGSFTQWISLFSEPTIHPVLWKSPPSPIRPPIRPALHTSFLKYLFVSESKIFYSIFFPNLGWWGWWFLICCTIDLSAVCYFFHILASCHQTG